MKFYQALKAEMVAVLKSVKLGNEIDIQCTELDRHGAFMGGK